MKRVILLASIVIGLLFAAVTHAQDAKLVEAAKKEGGKVVLYGSLEPDTTDLIINAFTKKTGLQVEYWRATTTKVVDRALAESRAKKALVDVILVHDAEMRFLFKEKIVARYDSPMFKDFTKESVDYFERCLMLFSRICCAAVGYHDRVIVAHEC